MARKFTKVSSQAFKAIQTDAGMLLNSFNPNNPVTPSDSQIICLTTGGINPSCVPQFQDFAEDIDNLPNNTKEFKKITGYECGISTTCYDTTLENIRLSLGAADVNVETSKITPRMDLKNSDFADIWWVGDRLDGGWVAIRLINALSTGGFSIQTSKNGKGTIGLTLTGHVSISNQDQVPMEFYSSDGEVSLTLAPRYITFQLGDTAHPDITVTERPSSTSTVTFSSSDTETVTVNSYGEISALKAGIAIITGSTTYESVTYTDEVVVRVTAAPSP